MKITSQKGLAPILIILLIAAAIGGYLVYSGKVNLNQTTTQVSQPTPASTSNNVVCAEKKTYRSLEEALKEPDRVCYLDLSSKNLTELPKEVLQFSNLQSLYLNYNKITSMPEDIINLKNLTLIDLTGNPITKDEIDKIKKLLPKTNIFNIQSMNHPQ